MNCLVLTSDFPNRYEPWRGPFHRRQFECLSALCGVSVIEPLAWPRIVQRPALAGLPGKPEQFLDGITAYHPIFWHLPVLGRRRLWRGGLSAVRRALMLAQSDAFDVVLATFAYPHGLMAREVAGQLSLPYVVKVRGTDLHGLPREGWRRDLTARALDAAAAVVAVSGNLAAIARELGVRADRIHLLPNGVDGGAFAALPRADARRKLHEPEAGRLLLFVGRLVAVKGVDVLLRALAAHNAATPERAARLVLVGEGPLRGRLESLAAELGLAGSVRFLGQRPPEEVALWLNAADALVLSSHNEGCPNVVLEALSCGTPVVASRVGAVPDLLDARCGVICQPGDPAALADALGRALATDWDRSAIRARVEGMSWQKNAQRLHEILRGVLTTDNT